MRGSDGYGAVYTAFSGIEMEHGYFKRWRVVKIHDRVVGWCVLF